MLDQTLRDYLLFMETQPGKVFLPALPRFIMREFLCCNSPAFDVHTFPYLLVYELVDLDTKPTRDMLSFPGHLFEFGEVCQRSLPRQLRAGLSKPVGRIVLAVRHSRKL